MIDLSIIHPAITIATSLGMLYIAARSFLSNRADKKHDKEHVCEIRMQQMETKIAVLEERLENEIDMLNRVDDKLDKIRDAL